MRSLFGAKKRNLFWKRLKNNFDGGVPKTGTQGGADFGTENGSKMQKKTEKNMLEGLQTITQGGADLVAGIPRSNQN